ncbi:MAG: hypothetical protein AB7E68_00225 [Candidatus Babeliales bacterium]
MKKIVIFALLLPGISLSMEKKEVQIRDSQNHQMIAYDEKMTIGDLKKILEGYSGINNLELYTTAGYEFSWLMAHYTPINIITLQDNENVTQMVSQYGNIFNVRKKILITK